MSGGVHLVLFALGESSESLAVSRSIRWLFGHGHADPDTEFRSATVGLINCAVLDPTQILENMVKGRLSYWVWIDCLSGALVCA